MHTRILVPGEELHLPYWGVGNPKAVKIFASAKIFALRFAALLGLGDKLAKGNHLHLPACKAGLARKRL